MEQNSIHVSRDMVRRGSFKQEEDGIFVIPDADGVIELSLTEKGKMRNWKNYSYLILEMNADMDAMANIDFCFCKRNEKEPSNVLNYQMIPGRDVTVLVRFDELKSVRFFLKTMPGMLKGHCSGLPASIEEMGEVFLRLRPGWSREFRGIRLNRCYLTCVEPEIQVAGEPMADQFGQWIQKEWDTKTHSEEELKINIKAEYERAETDCGYPEGFSRFGGTTGVRFDKTGYFHLARTKERWWLVDPDGYGFFSNGVCYGSRMGVFGFVDGMENLFSWLPDPEDPRFREAWTNAGEIPEYAKRNGKESGTKRKMFNFARANLIRVFGPDGWWDAWNKINTARLKRWGFNTIGVGVNNYFDERVLDYLEKAKMPFVWTLKNFPQTREKIFRDFPDVFSEEYRQEAERFAIGQLAPFRQNPYLIGYFINNEPEWKFQNANLAERVFANQTELKSREVLIEWLKVRYGTVEELNRSWKTAFGSYDTLRRPFEGAGQTSAQAAGDCQTLHDMLVEQYETTVAKELKKVDGDHLDLGMRYSSGEAAGMAGCAAHDVFSFNLYRPEPETALSACSGRSDVPMIIGEYHIGGGDKGNLAHGLLASPTQDERGKALEYYMQRAMSHPNCVGAHYFEMNDQPLLGRFDGECMEHGLIDICNREFGPLVKHLQNTNRQMYDYVQGKKKPTDIQGELVYRR